MVEETHAERLERIPFLGEGDPSKWPKTVRPIAIDEMNRVGIDKDGQLYWDGKPIVTVTERRFMLTGLQKAGAVIVTLAAIAGGVGGCAQGIGSTYDLGCKRAWWVQGCPK